MSLSAEGQIDAFMAHAVDGEPLSESRLVHEIDGALLEHPGAHTLDHVLFAANFDDERIDSAQVEEMAEHQPRRPGADNPNLGPDPFHLDRLYGVAELFRPASPVHGHPKGRTKVLRHDLQSKQDRSPR
jgi:hypothetical protein